MPVPEKDLPVILPEDCVPDGSGNPLAKRADFVNTTCPKCGGAAKRETDTMDTFVDSSWYYMRYACPDAPTMVDARNDYWNPMDQYIGGIDARDPAPALRALLDQGDARHGAREDGRAVHATCSRRAWCSTTATSAARDKGGIDYYAPDDVEVDARRATARSRARGSRPTASRVEYGGIGTMSKSKLNGVDPQDIIDRYGADAARLFVMFAAHPEATLEWSDAGVEGASRFLKRLWTFAQAHAGSGAAPATPIPHCRRRGAQRGARCTSR